jgi:hypothetical protein
MLSVTLKVIGEQEAEIRRLLGLPVQQAKVEPVVEPSRPKPRYPNDGKPYEDEENALIRANQGESMQEVGRALGRKPNAVYTQAIKLGVRLRRH